MLFLGVRCPGQSLLKTFALQRILRELANGSMDGADLLLFQHG